MRLQQYLARCGVASRRAAEKLIEEGRIEVNGRVAALGESVNPATDVVTHNGRRLREERFVYILLNKARNVVTTATDTHGRPTVLDGLHGVPARVFPVGRLDMDVQGALLLTNDGELAYRLMHPRFETPKVYLAKVRGRVLPETIARLERGILLDDGPAAPAQAAIVHAGEQTTTLRLTLHEGRKHEVKRMCEAAGHRVVELRRASFAGITTRGLRPGQWRYLSGEEVAALRRMTGMTGP